MRDMSASRRSVAADAGAPAEGGEAGQGQGGQRGGELERGGEPERVGPPSMYSAGYQLTKATGTTNVSAWTASVGKIVSGNWVSVLPP